MIENQLEEFDRNYISYKLEGRISLGIEIDGHLVAGLDASMTAFKILYLSTLFVDKPHRNKGYGKKLIFEMERQAKELGANTVRVDTFSWQGKDFYLSMGYEQVGYYNNPEDAYEEYFFIKRL